MAWQAGLPRTSRGFGKGDPRGIVSPETADHSAGTAALLPMLALGVPGSATAAVMMGGLMIWGLTPGPMLFIDRPDFVWGLIASMYLGNVVAVDAGTCHGSALCVHPAGALLDRRAGDRGDHLFRRLSDSKFNLRYVAGPRLSAYLAICSRNWTTRSLRSFSPWSLATRPKMLSVNPC